jgi:DNA polymerase V
MKLHRIHKTKTIDFFSASTETAFELPLIDEGIKAGFPSPANDFIDASIDLNKELIKNPSSTFFGRVHGDSMQDFGIHHGDLLVIDKSLEPREGKIAVCYIDGEFTIKKIHVEKDYCLLLPANKKYRPIKVTSDNDFIVWGIVIHVIKSF